MGPVRQNPIQRTVRSVHMCVQFIVYNLLHTILRRTDLIILPLTPQTIYIAPMMSISGKGEGSSSCWFQSFFCAHREGVFEGTGCVSCAPRCVVSGGHLILTMGALIAFFVW